MIKNNDDKPPRTPRIWRNLYLFVAGTLVALIVLFYLFTKHFQ